MKKNNILLIMLISLSLIFAGCSSNSDAKQSGLFSGIGKGSSSSSNSDSGLSLTFAENNPPSKMIKGAPVNFAFIFTNAQKHEITDLRIKTKGFERSYVSGLAEEYNINLIPKATLQTGEGIYTGLQVSGVSVDGFTNSFLFNPKFEYCYTAKTSYVEQLCVPSTQNTCSLKVDKSIDSNGPIKVNIDRVNSIENNIRIDFSIYNSGNGKVVNECFKTDDYSNDYKLNSVKLGTTEGACTAISDYKLNNGKSNFYCEFTRTSNEEYASQLSVKIGYKYNQEVQKQIVVEDLNIN